jgi:pyrroloquinoline-quinone synthase
MNINVKPVRADFWQTIEQRSAVHPLHNHRYFKYLLGPEGDLPAVKLFSEQFYLFCVTFHRCLGGVVSNTPDQRIIAMLAENLYDEMGRGNIAESHLEILKRFSRSLGYSDAHIAAIKPLPSTVELNDKFIAVAKEDFYVGIGAVGLGAEYAGAQFFRNVYASFVQKPFLRNADTKIYEIHAEDDTRHREDMKAALSALNFSAGQETDMLLGVELSEMLFFNFWEGVGEASGFYKAERRPLPTTASAFWGS